MAGTVDLRAHPGNYQIAGIDDFFGNSSDDILWTSVNSNGTVATDIWELNSSGQWMASDSRGLHPAEYNVVASAISAATDRRHPVAKSDQRRCRRMADRQWPMVSERQSGLTPWHWLDHCRRWRFFGNGIDDVLWTNASGSQVQIAISELGSNGQWINSSSPGSHPVGYQVGAIGNFIGNGTDGVLWYDPINGDVDEWVLGITANGPRA